MKKRRQAKEEINQLIMPMINVVVAETYSR
jgi:hypothetical protein